MSVLAEGESLSSYNRKRLALSFQLPPQAKRKKSHSPSEQNLAGNVNGAMDEISLPDDERINWSAMARKYNSNLDQQKVTPHQRRCKKRLPGGEISTPCLPTKGEIMDEKETGRVW